MRYVIEPGSIFHEILARAVSDGDVVYLNDQGQIHRDAGPAVMCYGNGDGLQQEWYENGKRHRLDGPAVDWESGYKAYWVNGEKHRVGGPAVMWSDGCDGDKEWWLRGHSAQTGDVLPHSIMWEFLHSDPESFQALTHHVLTKEMQEYVIEHRPDLIGKIKNLDPDPDLAQKYQRELELTKVDL